MTNECSDPTKHEFGSSPRFLPFPGVEITSYRGEEDSAKVIQIDTRNDEHIRINLNDAPVFDGSPEHDEPRATSHTGLTVVGVTLEQLENLAENAYVNGRSRADLHWTQLSNNTRKKRINDLRFHLQRVGITVEK